LCNRHSRGSYKEDHSSLLLKNRRGKKTTPIPSLIRQKEGGEGKGISPQTKMDLGEHLPK